MNRAIAFGIAAAFSAAIVYCGVLPSGTPNFVGNADIDGQARMTKTNLAPEGIDASLDFPWSSNLRRKQPPECLAHTGISRFSRQEL